MTMAPNRNQFRPAHRVDRLTQSQLETARMTLADALDDYSDPAMDLRRIERAVRKAQHLLRSIRQSLVMSEDY